MPHARSSAEPAAPVAARPPEPHRAWAGPVTLAVLLLVCWRVSVQTGLPRPVPASAPDTVFSAERAMSVISDIARAPHPTGSPEHERVRGVLVERLRQLGLEPEVQTSASIVQAAGVVRAGTMRNVVARIPGTSSTGAVLITAHYDARTVAPGAADDGSGVGVILEAARALLAGPRPRNEVILLLTDGEEVGLLGARAFVDGHPWMRDVALVLSFDMRGSAGPSIMFETNDENGWVVRALKAFAKSPRANSLSYEVYERLPNSTDFTPFLEAGEQGLNFAAIGNGHVYHQADDVPANLSRSTLQQHGDNALAALRYFGSQQLDVVSAPNVVYFSVPLLGLVIYPERWVAAVSLLALLLTALTIALALRGGARWRGIVLSLLFSLAVVACSAAFGWVLLRIIPRFHGELGSLQGSALHSEGWYVVALAAAAFAVHSLVGVAARRWWLSPAELALGGLALPLALAVAAGATVPLAAMNLQWPVVAALVGAMSVSWRAGRAPGTVAWVVSVVSAAVVLALMVPVIELLWMAMTIRLAVVLGAVFAVTLSLCVPALLSLRAPNRWWAPALGATVALAGVGLGVLSSRPSAERPAPSTLVYVYDQRTGSSMWVTEPSLDPADAAALEWVYSKAGRDFSGRGDFSGFGYVSGNLAFAEAPSVSAPPPEVIAVSDSVQGATRDVRLRVRSRIGAEMIQFRYPEGSSTRLLSIDGLQLEAPETLRWADHWGEPDGAIELVLQLPPGDPIQLDVIEHLLRPQALLGPEPFARPPELAPNIAWMSDRAMLRYSVASLVGAAAVEGTAAGGN